MEGEVTVSQAGFMGLYSGHCSKKLHSFLPVSDPSSATPPLFQEALLDG
jgi:hypothetical protein